MKNIVLGLMTTVAVVIAFVACENEIDEVSLWNRMEANSTNIGLLQKECEKININVDNFIKIVEAQQKNLTIKEAYPNEEGFLIVFSDGTFAQLLNGKDGVNGKDGIDGKDGVNGKDGKDGVNGKDGVDGYVPAIAIKKGADGVYYWICDGKFLLDENGAKIPAQGKDGVNGTNGSDGINGQDGVTPEFKIENGYWYVSYNGKDWVKLGQATGNKGNDGSNGNNGNDGITPKLKIVEGYWFISYDGGETYEEDPVGKATGESGLSGKDGVTPKLKIKDGKWFVSYDEGSTWQEIEGGEIIENTTGNQDYDGLIDGFEYVDLGLSVKWATYNVGATKPEECGVFFAWGEVGPKDKADYSWKTYKWSEEPDTTLTKYNITEKYGNVDNLVTLTASDDAATVNWGSKWRTPTADELMELHDLCEIEIVDDYKGTGIAGVVFTSTINKNKIFLPAAGYKNRISWMQKNNTDNGTGGFRYWSSSLYESTYWNQPYRAYCISHKYGTAVSSRDVGYQIRAVSDK